MTEALVTKELITWARERHNVSQEVVAKKIGVPIERLRSWEQGEAKPTFRQAQNLADGLNIPFGALFLSKPPVEDLPLPDLRTVAGAPGRRPSADFLDLLYDVLRKQDWYREHLEEEQTEARAFVGRFTVETNPIDTAADIVRTLGIDEDMRLESDSWTAFLTQFVRKAESAGVLVLRSGIVGNNVYRKLDVEEVRGFAIADGLAPLIFINSRDAKAAQIFTLAHELAHIWVGESGISNPDYTVTPGEQRNRIDRVCDEIAAETLVPATDFTSHWLDRESVPANLQRLGARYRVSQFVVLRRALEMEKITQDQFWTYHEQLLAQSRQPGGDGGNFYTNLLARNSTTLTYALLAAAGEGSVSLRDAARLLNLRMQSFENARARLLKGAGTGA